MAHEPGRASLAPCGVAGQKSPKDDQLAAEVHNISIAVCVPLLFACRRQQLLPSEAGRLQGLLLSQLLPALRPNLAQLNKRQLARLVFSLGSCYAAAAGQEQEQEEGQQQQPPGMQGEAKLRSSGPNPQQQQQQQHGGATLNQEEPAETSESAAGVAAVPKDSLSPDSSSGGSRGRRSLPSLRAARAAAAAAAASAAWVLRLLPLLPPSSLTAGALLSVWQGCALHELRPPGDWLQQASWVMVGHLRGRKLDFNDMAGLLQVKAGAWTVCVCGGAACMRGVE